MNNELFLMTPLALPVPSLWILPSDPSYLKCWLRPLYPEPEERIMSPEGWKEAFKVTPLWPPFPAGVRLVSPLMYTAVDSRRPALRWSAFPQEINREKPDSTVLNRISDVTYDLKIWEAVRGSRG